MAGVVSEGDARPGDAHPGDAHSGDARSGDARPGDARPGDAHPGDARSTPRVRVPPGLGSVSQPRLPLTGTYLPDMCKWKSGDIKIKLQTCIKTEPFAGSGDD